MKNNIISRKARLKSKRQAPANYLIVCEGKKTEPNYFNGLKKKINEKYGNKVDVLIPNIEVKGTGMNTTSLVKYTQKTVNHANKVYGQVWVVFDKDDYNDEQFNTAIENCNYKVAWSNPNFELWLLSHFKKVNRCISKDDVLQELSKEFQKNGLGDYAKNDEDIFNKVTSEGKLHTAIKNCEYMEELNKKAVLNDDEVIAIIAKQIKTRKESIVEFEKGNRCDLIDKTNKEAKEIISNIEQKDVEDILNLAMEQYDKGEFNKAMTTVVKFLNKKPDDEYGLYWYNLDTNDYQDTDLWVIQLE